MMMFYLSHTNMAEPREFREAVVLRHQLCIARVTLSFKPSILYKIFASTWSNCSSEYQLVFTQGRTLKSHCLRQENSTQLSRHKEYRCTTADYKC